MPGPLPVDENEEKKTTKMIKNYREKENRKSIGSGWWIVGGTDGIITVECLHIIQMRVCFWPICVCTNLHST